MPFLPRLGVDFPTANAFQPSLGGEEGQSDAFIAKFKPDGSGLAYSSFLGGSIDEQGFAMAVDATSPTGAVVTFTTSAEDDVDGSVSVSCTPASGATFAVGTTLVACTASDAAGNTVDGSFSVTVRSPAEMTSNLSQPAASYNAPQSVNLLGNVLTQASQGNLSAACNNLNAFMNQTGAQAGKKLTSSQAAELITAATQLQSALACQ